MRSYDNANCIVRREQTADSGGQFYFFQKAKLKAIHVFAKPDTKARKSGEAKFGEVNVWIGDEQIGKAILSESFTGTVQSTPLLDVVIPQGSVVYVDGDTTGLALIAEYEVMPDADETTTNVERR